MQPLPEEWCRELASEWFCEIRDSSDQLSSRRITDPCVIRVTHVCRHVVGTASFESNLIFFIHSSVDEHKSALKFVKFDIGA